MSTQGSRVNSIHKDLQSNEKKLGIILNHELLELNEFLQFQFLILSNFSNLKNASILFVKFNAIIYFLIRLIRVIRGFKYTNEWISIVPSYFFIVT